MKTVEQREHNDCGVACVAMLAGVKYTVARAAVYGDGRSKLTRTKDLHDALVGLGRKPLATRRTPFRSREVDDLDKDALIFVELKRCGSKHWVVWDCMAKKVRDPVASKPKHKLLGYLLVD